MPSRRTILAAALGAATLAVVARLRWVEARIDEVAGDDDKPTPRDVTDLIPAQYTAGLFLEAP